MNELIRKPENVFVDIKDLNEVSPVTPSRHSIPTDPISRLHRNPNQPQ